MATLKASFLLRTHDSDISRDVVADEGHRGSGSIHVIMGPMFSGKSTSLLRRIKYEISVGRTDYAETVKSARCEYNTRPVYGWGDVGAKQKSTAGWPAAFLVFKPHWQICMAGVLQPSLEFAGWIEWGGERFEFRDAPSYSEKNWGGGFPRKWFWVQCNVFEGAKGEVALTATGGLRQLPGLTETYENVALVCVHYDGKFYEFVPWDGVVRWEMSPWGYWYMTAENETHMVELEARTNEAGTPLR